MQKGIVQTIKNATSLRPKNLGMLIIQGYTKTVFFLEETFLAKKKQMINGSIFNSLKCDQIENLSLY